MRPTHSPGLGARRPVVGMRLPRPKGCCRACKATGLQRTALRSSGSNTPDPTTAYAHANSGTSGRGRKQSRGRRKRSHATVPCNRVVRSATRRQMCMCPPAQNTRHHPGPTRRATRPFERDALPAQVRPPSQDQQSRSDEPLLTWKAGRRPQTRQHRQLRGPPTPTRPGRTRRRPQPANDVEPRDTTPTHRDPGPNPLLSNRPTPSTTPEPPRETTPAPSCDVVPVIQCLLRELASAEEIESAAARLDDDLPHLAELLRVYGTKTHSRRQSPPHQDPRHNTLHAFVGARQASDATGRWSLSSTRVDGL